MICEFIIAVRHVIIAKKWNFTILCEQPESNLSFCKIFLALSALRLATVKVVRWKAAVDAGIGGRLIVALGTTIAAAKFADRSDTADV